MFRKLFGGERRDETSPPAEALVLVPIPPLVTVLLALAATTTGFLYHRAVYRSHAGRCFPLDCGTVPRTMTHETPPAGFDATVFKDEREINGFLSLGLHTTVPAR